MEISEKDNNAPVFDSLSIVIPVFNSESTIQALIEKIHKELSPFFTRIEIILVNDGSSDKSHERVLEIIDKYPDIIKYANLARNFGEHNAVMCGLRFVSCECAVIIDDDFQNPPAEILKLVQKLSEGYDVVYSYYEHKQHHWFRNIGSKFNDWASVSLLNKPKGLYLSSFKVMTKFLAKTVTLYNGPFPYIDGLILRSTHSIGTQLCEHQARDIGQSNYNLRRLVRLWLNMATSFSIVPLRLSSILGFIMSGVGFLLALFFIISWSVGGLFTHEDFPRGWASLIVSITIFAGIQLVVLGTVGEYVGRIFLTQNQQPQFIIRQTYGAKLPGDNQ